MVTHWKNDVFPRFSRNTVISLMFWKRRKKWRFYGAWPFFSKFWKSGHAKQAIFRVRDKPVFPAFLKTLAKSLCFSKIAEKRGFRVTEKQTVLRDHFFRTLKKTVTQMRAGLFSRSRLFSWNLADFANMWRFAFKRGICPGFVQNGRNPVKLGRPRPTTFSYYYWSHAGLLCPGTKRCARFLE